MTLRSMPMPTQQKGVSPNAKVQGSKKDGSYLQAHTSKANRSPAASPAPTRSPAATPAAGRAGASTTGSKKPSGTHGTPTKNHGYSARAAVHVHAQACAELPHTFDMAADDHARLMAIMQADDLPVVQCVSPTGDAHDNSTIPSAGVTVAGPISPRSHVTKPHLRFMEQSIASAARRLEDTKTMDSGSNSTVQLLKQLLRSSTEGPASFKQAASMLAAEASSGSLPAGPTTSAAADGTMQSNVLSMLRGPNAQSGPLLAGPLNKSIPADNTRACHLLMSKSAVALNRTATPAGEVSPEGLLASSLHTQRRYNRNAQSFAARASTRVRSACTLEQRKHMMVSGSHMGLSTGTGSLAPSTTTAADGQGGASYHALRTIVSRSNADASPAAGEAAQSSDARPEAAAAAGTVAHSFTCQHVGDAAAHPAAPSVLPSQASFFTSTSKENIMSTQSFNAALPNAAAANIQASTGGPAAASSNINAGGSNSVSSPRLRRRRSKSRTRKTKSRRWWSLTCGLFRGCEHPHQTMSRTASDDSSSGGASEVFASMPVQQARAAPAAAAAMLLPAADAVQAIQGVQVSAATGSANEQSTCPERGRSMAHDDHHDSVQLHSPRVSDGGGKASCGSASEATASAGGVSAAAADMSAGDAMTSNGEVHLPSVGELQNMELANMLHTLQGMLLASQPMSSCPAPPRYGPASAAAIGSAQPSRNTTAGGTKPAALAKLGSRRRSSTKDAALTGALHVTHAPGAVAKPACHLNSPFFTFGLQKKQPTGTHVVDGKAFSLPAYLLQSPRLSTYVPPWQRSPDAAHYVKWVGHTAASKSGTTSPSGTPRGSQPASPVPGTSLLQAAQQKRGSQQMGHSPTWRPAGSQSPRNAWWSMNAEASPRRSAAMQSSVASSMNSMAGALARARPPVAVVVPTGTAVPRTLVHGMPAASVHASPHNSKGGAEPAAQPSFNVMLHFTDGGSSDEMQASRGIKAGSFGTAQVFTTHVSLTDLLQSSTATAQLPRTAATPVAAPDAVDAGQAQTLMAAQASAECDSSGGFIAAAAPEASPETQSTMQSRSASRQDSDVQATDQQEGHQRLGTLSANDVQTDSPSSNATESVLAAADGTARVDGTFTCAQAAPSQESAAGLKSSAGGLLSSSCSLKCDDLDLDLTKPGEVADRTSVAMSNAGLAPPHDPHWTSSRGASVSGSSSSSTQCTPSKVAAAVSVVSTTPGEQRRLLAALQARTPSLKGTPASPLRTASRASSSHMLMAALDPLAAGIPNDAKEAWTPAALKHYEAALDNVETILAQEQTEQDFC